MRAKIISFILGTVCLSIVLGVLFISPSPATANPQPEPPSTEKQDFSRGRQGTSVFSDITAENTILSPTATDRFGYTLSLITPAWKDAKTGTEILFSTRDDDYSEPIGIGFNFPFYENTYSELYVSTNGMISFGEENDAFENREIPRDTLPNNFIAPFWDDLLFIVDTSHTYYKKGTDAQGKFIVVEWYLVSRLDTQNDRLTFEVVLRENGNILFQYNRLDGTLNQATVGIEDDQGVDGNLYIFNYAGLKTTDAIQFKYPAPSARAKIYPLNQGDFVSDGDANLQFTVRNIGDLGKDTFDFKLSTYNTSWQVTFYDADGFPLSDTNGNGIIDTGPLDQEDELVVKIRVKAPKTAQVGGNIQVILSAVSSRNTNKKAQATFSVAVPTPFAQALQTGTLMRLHLVWRENQISASASPEQFFGSNLAVQRLGNGNYFYSWEQNSPPGSEITYANLKFTILSDLGGILLDEKSLTNNSNVTERTEDRYLVSSITSSSDLIGVIWVRSIYRVFGSGSQAETKSNQNIFFAILDKNGNIVISPKNLTNNTLWRGKSDLGVPYYISPKISTTDDNRFVMAWTKDVEMGGGKISNIEYMIFNSTGSRIKSDTLLTESQPDGIYYITPMIEKMKQNRALISYAKIQPNPGTSNLVYKILDSNGNILSSETAITNSDGATNHDCISLGSSILLAWPSVLNGDVGFSLLDRDNASVISPTKYMASPNLRDAASVSVARDKNGRGVVTWVDRNQSQFLYYMLVSDNGTKLTPEMIYLTATGYTVNTNAYGYGLTSYEGTWQTILPLVSR